MLKRHLLSLFIILSLFSSCVVTESFDIEKETKGSSTSDIGINQFFLNVLEDFSDFVPQNGQSVMDDAMLNFTSRLNASPFSSSVTLRTDGRSRRYIISLDYSSLPDLISDLNGGKDNTVLNITQSSMTMNLNIDNYEELESVIPFLSDPNFEVYGPRYSYGMTEEEYKDMISFLLGEEGPAALDKSLVSVEITTPGDITYTKGITKTESRKAVFTFSVIDFLLLNEPLSFTVRWK